jgi:hypothetical protein
MFYPVFLAALMQAQALLPELKVEATDGGSAFVIQNPTQKPLASWLIELVGYPGSTYALWIDETGGNPIAPGATRRIPVVNMTIGAAPEYVKLQAALYADGSGAGPKAGELVALRKKRLDAARELIERLDKGEGAAQLKAWAESIPQPTRAQRNTHPALLNSATRDLIQETVAALDGKPRPDVVQGLKALRAALEASKPAL